MHLTLNFEKKKRLGRCLTPYCRNAARQGRNFCNSCRSRRYDDPLKRVFWNLKGHAKARGKEFALTFEDFAAAALESGYLAMSGRSRGCLHVDRIDPRLGYVPGNIQFLGASENSRKGNEDKRVLACSCDESGWEKEGR